MLLLVLSHLDPKLAIGTLSTGQAVTRRGRHGIGKFHAALLLITNINRPTRAFRRQAVANEAEAHATYHGVGGQIFAGGGNQCRSESRSIPKAVQDAGNESMVGTVVPSMRQVEGVGCSHVLDVVAISVAIISRASIGCWSTRSSSRGRFSSSGGTGRIGNDLDDAVIIVTVVTVVAAVVYHDQRDGGGHVTSLLFTRSMECLQASQSN